MSAAVATIAFILGLLAPINDADAVTCIYKDWTWGDGGYKICWYDCAGKTVPHFINTTETCPDTVDKQPKT